MSKSPGGLKITKMNRLDASTRRLLRRGYEVTIAVDGAQGVAAAMQQPPDIVLMDMSLPVIDGWEATRRLKAAPRNPRDPHHRPDGACHARRP